MKSLVLKFFFTLLAWIFILSFAIPWSNFWLEVPLSGPEYRLGLDLQWWIELDYMIDLEKAKSEEGYSASRKTQIIEGLKSIIDKRIETLWINDSVITDASYGGEEHIIVQIPLKWNSSLENSQNIERAKEAIGKVVKIEFKESKQVTESDIQDRSKLAETLWKTLSEKPDIFPTEILRYRDSYEWITLWYTEEIKDIFSPTSSWSILEENTLIPWEIRNGALRDSWYIVFQKSKEGNEYIFISGTPSNWKIAQDSKGRVLDDRYFVNASIQYNEAFQPMIELTFNTQWAQIFWELSKRLVWKPMAIFVGWELLTAPTINEAILSGRAVITGQYTPEEAAKLANDINTWVVPAPIYLTSERTIDARLWANSLEKIVFAGLASFVLILIFLILIYRTSGLIAALALFIYIVLVLAILKQFSIVLTLASIAWLVLSLGIAIDANILIFERIKEELRQKKSLKEAIKNWFASSFSAIWDANLTGLIVALILFIFGVNMIKGFGFILGLGIIVSLFSVYFISRLFIQLLGETSISKKTFIGKL